MNMARPCLTMRLVEHRERESEKTKLTIYAVCRRMAKEEGAFNLFAEKPPKPKFMQNNGEGRREGES